MNNNDYLKEQLISMAIAKGQTRAEGEASYNAIKGRVGPIFGFSWDKEAQQYVEIKK